MPFPPPIITWRSASNLKKSSGKWGYYSQNTTLGFVSHFHCDSSNNFSTLSYCKNSIKSNAMNFLKIKQISKNEQKAIINEWHYLDYLWLQNSSYFLPQIDWNKNGDVLWIHLYPLHWWSESPRKKNRDKFWSFSL